MSRQNVRRMYGRNYPNVPRNVGSGGETAALRIVRDNVRCAAQHVPSCERGLFTCLTECWAYLDERLRRTGDDVREDQLELW